jgi:DNA-binding transcriptional LysR family regulator
MRPNSAPSWDAAFAISSALGQVEAVRSGAGIGILHTFIARAATDLVPVSAIPPIRRSYWLVYHESVRTRARTIRLISVSLRLRSLRR